MPVPLSYKVRKYRFQLVFIFVFLIFIYQYHHTSSSSAEISAPVSLSHNSNQPSEDYDPDKPAGAAKHQPVPPSNDIQNPAAGDDPKRPLDSEAKPKDQEVDVDKVPTSNKKPLDPPPFKNDKPGFKDSGVPKDGYEMKDDKIAVAPKPPGVGASKDSPPIKHDGPGVKDGPPPKLGLGTKDGPSKHSDSDLYDDESIPAKSLPKLPEDDINDDNISPSFKPQTGSQLPNIDAPTKEDFLTLDILTFGGANTRLKAAKKKILELLPRISKLPRKDKYPVDAVIPIPKPDFSKAMPKIQAEKFQSESSTEKATRLNRLEKVKEVFLISWNQYKQYAWGKDEIMPVSQEGFDPFAGWSATLVDALDTLIIMDLKDEFSEALEVVNSIDFTTTFRKDIPLFETVIRYLGGLLSAYDLASPKEPILLDKAIELGDNLMGAFDTPNRMPKISFLWTDKDQKHSYRASSSSPFAEIGSLSVEFTRLAQLTGNNKYFDAIDRITTAIYNMAPNNDIPYLFDQKVDASGCKVVPLKGEGSAKGSVKSPKVPVKELEEPPKAAKVPVKEPVKKPSNDAAKEPIKDVFKQVKEAQAESSAAAAAAAAATSLLDSEDSPALKKQQVLDDTSFDSELGSEPDASSDTSTGKLSSIDKQAADKLKDKVSEISKIAEDKGPVTPQVSDLDVEDTSKSSKFDTSLDEAPEPNFGPEDALAYEIEEEMNAQNPKGKSSGSIKGSRDPLRSFNDPSIYDDLEEGEGPGWVSDDALGAYKKKVTEESDSLLKKRAFIGDVDVIAKKAKDAIDAADAAEAAEAAKEEVAKASSTESTDIDDESPKATASAKSVVKPVLKSAAKAAAEKAGEKKSTLKEDIASSESVKKTDTKADTKADIKSPLRNAVDGGIQRVINIYNNGRSAIMGCEPQAALAPVSNAETAPKYTVGGLTDSTYEYFVKEYLLLHGADERYAELHIKMIEAVNDNLLFRPLVEGDPDILFVGNKVQRTPTFLQEDNEMSHLSCFVGGMYAMGSKVFKRPADLELAAKLTEGCVWAYNVTRSGVMPENFHVRRCPSDTAEDCHFDFKTIDSYMEKREKAKADQLKAKGVDLKTYSPSTYVISPDVDEISDGRGGSRWPFSGYYDMPRSFLRMDAKYILRPEALESVFYMYRISGQHKWQEKGWQMFENILKLTEIKGTTSGDDKKGKKTVIGYSGVHDVTDDRGTKGNLRDEAESFWMAETLKYVYLLMSDPSAVSLDEYVFNTEAHPLLRPSKDDV